MPPAPLKLPSFAKINWNLRVLGKRPDGFHELCTVFQTVSLCDEITFEPADDVSLTCSDPRIPVGEENLVVRAARLLQRESGLRRGARIHLEKRIPAPGGLGGGSSNAAVTLLGLSVLWDLRPSPGTLRSLAAELGSDVPFFLYGGTAAGTGRGENIEPVPELACASMLVVTPQADVPTGAAFAALNAPYLTTEDSKRILQICRRDARTLEISQSGLFNDFEESVFRMVPEIRRIRDRLLETGASAAQMSGSGASVFAVFDKEETRQATLDALQEETIWRKFAVATISRSQYREALNPCISLLPISF